MNKANLHNLDKEVIKASLTMMYPKSIRFTEEEMGKWLSTLPKKEKKSRKRNH
jgi:hypothetical protein